MTSKLRLMRFVIPFMGYCCVGCDPDGSADELAAKVESASVLLVDDPGRRDVLREALRARLGQAYAEPEVLDGGVRWDRGAQLYELLCQSCHGVDGSGGGRVSDQLTTSPGDLATPLDEAFFSARAQQEIVRGGSPDTPMIAWGETLEEPDLQALFKYVASLRREDRSER